MELFKVIDRTTELFHPQLRDLNFIMSLPFYDHTDYRNLTGVTRGLITVEEHGATVRGFRDYFLKHTPDSNSRNPWFAEYWEQVNNCTMGITCNNRHPFLHAGNFRQATYVPQVVASINAFAHALKVAQESLCNGTVKPCSALGSMSADRLRSYLSSSLFVNLDNTIVSFDENGDFANPTYIIKNLQVDKFLYRLNRVS